jgi:hypothetical protein
MNVRTTTLQVTANEMRLLIEALGKAASRHDSEARFYPRSANAHDVAADAMRKLKTKLMRGIYRDIDNDQIKPAS